MCTTCWNTARGLCVGCAPDAQVELEAAGAIEVAQAEGEARGKALDVTGERQLVCPSCGAQTHGARFCPECGQKL